MTSKISLARPYAKAAFAYSLEKKALSDWSEKLLQTSRFVSDATMAALIRDPEVTQEKVALALLDLIKEKNDGHFANFLRLLAQYHRLALLPEIMQLFVEYVLEYEKKSIAKVKTAVALDEAQKKQLQQVLSKKLGYDVKVENEIIADMLGGIHIQYGDQVIDYTLQGQLKELEKILGE